MLVLIILLLALVAVGAYMLGRSSVKVSEEDKVIDLRRCVNELLNLETVTQMAREHKEQKACLEELHELLVSYFFFHEFANPKDAYNDLMKRRDGINERTWDLLENKAIVRMYNKIIQEVNSSWLEKE